jgi:hypothetical protein
MIYWSDLLKPALAVWQRLVAPRGFIIAVLAVAALYAALQLTPSSYALALNMVGVKDTGLIVGVAHPSRSDEWAVWTPYIQIAINNGFARIEHISPYAADLRNFNTLPLADWALIFKPQMWAFFVLPPAFAFSLMFAMLFAASLIGWHLLARELRFSNSAAAIFSLSVFALPYVQLWWTTTGPLIAFFPWVLLACLVPMRTYVRIPILAWITTTFLLSHFYMILIASLAFAGGLAIIALRRDVVRLPRIAACLAAGALGFGLAVLYLWGPFQIMAQTVYPGHRSDLPGGLMPYSYVVAYLFPHFISAKWEAFYWNNLEVGTGGSYALLFALIFVNFHRLREIVFAQTTDDRDTRWALGVLSAGVLIILAWWCLPIPAVYAKPLFWNMSVGQRLGAAMGLLSHLVAFVLLLRVGAVASLSRVAIAVLLVATAAGVSKFFLFDANPRALKYDLAVVPLLLLAYWASQRVPAWGCAVLLCGAVSNAAIFIPFNPVQRAGPIFAKHDTPVLRAAWAKQEAHPKRWLVANIVPGAVAVGMGFRSIRHVTITPQLAFFRERFPDLPPDQFNQIFNRYAHIILDEEIKIPVVPQSDVIQVPQAPFE